MRYIELRRAMKSTKYFRLVKSLNESNFRKIELIEITQRKPNSDDKVPLPNYKGFCPHLKLMRVNVDEDWSEGLMQLRITKSLWLYLKWRA